MKSLQIIDESLEDNLNLKSFKKLNKAAIDELSKIPGLVKTTANFKDEHGVEMTTIVPLNYKAFLTATEILDAEPIILIIPSIILDAPLRKHQFNVHRRYSDLTSTFLKANPAVIVPEVYIAGGLNPVNLLTAFRSALVASLHEILRFQGNNNPAIFNDIPKGTILGEMTIYYGGKGHQLQLGPLAYIR